MILINFDGRKVKEGDTVKLRSANSDLTKVMTVKKIDYNSDKLILRNNDGYEVNITPDCWCLVYPMNVH